MLFLFFKGTLPVLSVTLRPLVSFCAGWTSRPAGPNPSFASGSTMLCGGTSIPCGWRMNPSSRGSFLSSSRPPLSSSSGRAVYGTSCGSCAASNWLVWWKQRTHASCDKTWWWSLCRCTLPSIWPASCLPNTLPFLPWPKAAGAHQVAERWLATISPFYPCQCGQPSC